MRAGTTPNGQPRSTALYEAILRLDNLDDCIRFFEDLCAASATVSRVNRMLNYGTGAVGKSVRYDLAAQQDGENSEGGTTE